MKFTISLSIEASGEPLQTMPVLAFDKECQDVANIGLSLPESKQLLEALQAQIVQQQANCFLAQALPKLPTSRVLKDYRPLTLRTLFGTVRLRSPRFTVFQLLDKPQTVSPLRSLLTQRTTPEMLYLETKWAASLSYSQTATLLKDVLPVDKKLNAATIRNHLGQVARQVDSHLSVAPLTNPADLLVCQSAVTEAEGPLVMGVDGGYLRDWSQKKTCFEVIVGKSVPAEQPAKCFGFVQGYDQQAKQRISELLNQQGLQGNQRVVFLSDGAANLRQLQSYLTPNAQHILDWFHLSMRFTVLQQYLQGLTKVDADGEKMQKRLESAKWHLWHGNTTKGLELIHDLDWDADLHRQEATTKYDKIKPLIRYISELESYIRQNTHLIVDYSERYRYGEVISTGFVESTVNYVVAKRFTKKQQMQWSKSGAHQMLVVRTKVLNDDWEGEFKKQYPQFRADSGAVISMAA
ncbi:ISKra4 family transposase (plasmid) [Spirosoma sp. SC4-14]|uniref:ISKra4 family transposase n=1 Tax=Spirosoma sp. SC4-14 TaxID=3128900 RepID=UPI0030D15638